ncbi:MAG: hypothetical protein IJ354_05915 [Clostridia bacterium]|nr:hypothetical protein [Clostridia bacterium]
MNKRLQKILALVLMACMLAGLLPAAAAESAQELVDAPVVTTSKTHITGRFLKENGAVYVAEATLLQLAPDISVSCSDRSHEVRISRPVPDDDGSGRDTAEFFIDKDDVHYAEDGMFFPFSTVMEQMKLNPVVMEEQGCLLILEAGDVEDLGPLMERIFDEPAYCMRYWKDSKNFRSDVELAELISAIRNHTLFEFGSGQTTRKGYRDAFAKLIKLQDVKEVNFATGANETLGVLNKVFSVAEDVSTYALQTLKKDVLGDLKGTIDAVSGALDTFVSVNENFGVEEQIQLFAYAHAMRDSEDSIIRGLREIRTETRGISIDMDTALSEALETYNEGTPLWQQSVERLSEKVVGNVEGMIVDLLPHSYLFEIGNDLTDLFFNTSTQLDATTNASRFLDVQTCCEQVFDEIWPYYEDSAREGRTRYLRILRDVTNLYLLAGVRAQEAMAEVDDMEAAANYCLKKLRAAQKQMAKFTDADIQCYENGAIAADWLMSLNSPQADTGNEVRYSTDGPLFITIRWNDPVNGQPMDMAANMTGMTDDGAEIYRAPTEGEYTSSSGPVAGHYIYDDEIVLEIYRHDAVMDVEVMYGDVMPFGAPSYSDANVEIFFADAQENVFAVIAANSDTTVYTGSPFLVDTDPFYLRGGAGVWYYGFRLDHGVLRSFSGEPAVLKEAEWDEYDDEANGGDEWYDWYEFDDEASGSDDEWYDWYEPDDEPGWDEADDPFDWFFPEDDPWADEPDDQPEWDDSGDEPGWVIIDGDEGSNEPDNQPEGDESDDEPGWVIIDGDADSDEPDDQPEWDDSDDETDWEPDYNPSWDEPAAVPTDRTLVDMANGGWLQEHYTPDGQLQTEQRYNAAGYMLYDRWYDNGECTGYTIWDYDVNGNLTLIRYANAMESGQAKLLFENIYSGGQLMKVELYNILGTLLGEGPTAADAADAVGMRMLVERAMPQ